MGDGSPIGFSVWMSIHMFIPLKASPVARKLRAASPAARDAGRREEQEVFLLSLLPLSCSVSLVAKRHSPELLS